MTRTIVLLLSCVLVVVAVYLTRLAHPDTGTVLVQLFAWLGGGLFYRLALEAQT